MSPRLTHAELADAHGRADWKVLWQHAIPLVKLVVGRMARGESIRREDADNDLLQEGMLIAGEAMRTWDPIECAFSTWITRRTRFDLTNYLNEKPNGGVAGRDQSVVILSTSDVRDDVAPSEDGDYGEDDPTFEGALTYEGVVQPGGQFDGTGEAPEGFGNPLHEAERELTKDVVRLAIDLLDPSAQQLLRAIYGIQAPLQSIADFAFCNGISVRTAERRLSECRKLLADKIARS